LKLGAPAIDFVRRLLRAHGIERTRLAPRLAR
jgi:hypothetical protein